MNSADKIPEAIAAITVLRNSETRAREEVKQLVDAESGSTKKSGEKVRQMGNR